ncbi:hypothetical protein K492DRAFT_209246 [Lichtheimia hyalospora FSU 10163]|nr:hypothetical protein K492DRAFT_209246 [Lichtheimia hyalospora FSU 10163]
MLAAETQHQQQQQQQPLKLTPEVLDRLRHLQQVDRPVSVDEVLHAANLDHLAQFPQPSKSSTAADMSPPLPETQAFPRKSRSTTTTLAERRRIPASTEKLKLYCQITHPTTTTTTTPPSMTSTTDSSTTTTTTTDNDNTSSTHNPTLERLEMENAQLSPQASEDYLLAHLERQNALLSADPKSVCIESNKLKADFNTIRNLGEHDNSNNDWEFWEYLVDDFTGAATKLPHLLVAKLSHGGIPDPLRGVVWRAMSQSSATHLESIYDKLVLEHSPSSSPYERVIQRDLSRTFPQVDMFKADGGEGQQAMGRLLRAYSVYDAHVGYCQGLAFLVGPLLMTMPEKDAFCVFVRLMETYDMRTMFTLNMEGLHLRLHQFSVLLAQLCPELSAHLNEHSVHPAMYASQWFLTLFAYSFPIDLVLRIYDLVFAEGAIETITRVAVAVMQKNQDILMEIHDFEKLMMYLSSRRPYEEGFSSDPESVIGDSMALSNVITRSKVDSIAAQHRKELEQEKSRAQQVLAIRFDQSAAAAVKANNKPTKNKRESWFSWASASQNRSVVVEQPASPVMSPTSPTFAATTGRASTSSISSGTGAAGQQMLHQQIEDLVLALSQLQKEHSQLSEEMMALKMRDMDRESERQQLAKRNQALEKRIRKYKSKLNASTSSANTMAALASPSQEDSNATRLEQLEHDPEFNSFVDSLRLSGDFGALIAGALDSTTQPKKTMEEEDEEEEQQPHDESGNMTNELVAVKLLNIQLNEKYNELNEKHQQLSRQLETARDAHRELLNKQAELQVEVETLGMTREQLLEEHDAIEDENHEMEEKLMAAKKTCAELQVEKLALAKQVEQLERRIAELEQEKREYLMPRGSFTEEVFAAHQTLFGANDKIKEQEEQPSTGNSSNSEYQKKYVDSELRCRELEKLLAETKCKLAEYESCPSSPRLSHPPPSRRRSMRNSMLSAGSRMSLPPTCEPGRVSTDSITSCGSGISSKRSSMYSRLFGNTTPANANGNKGNAPTPITNANLVEEPQHV